MHAEFTNRWVIPAVILGVGNLPDPAAWAVVFFAAAAAIPPIQKAIGNLIIATTVAAERGPATKRKDVKKRR